MIGRLAYRLASLRRRRGAVVAASALFVSHQVGELMVPVLTGAIIDRAVATGDGAALVRWGLLLLVAFACLSTSWRWGDRILTGACERAGHDLRLDVTRRVLDHEGMAGSGPVGQTVSVASSDVDAAVEAQSAVAHTAAAMAAILVASSVLLVISVPLGLVVVLGLPPVLAVVHVLARPIEARVADQQADVARAASTATDLLAGLRVLKGLHAEDEAASRYGRASRRSLAAGLRATRLRAAHGGLTTGVTGVFLAVVALIGGRLAADGTITVGALIAAIGVTQFLVGPLERIGYAAAVRSAARASAARVADVLAAPPAAVDGTEPAPEGEAGVSLRSVRFGPLDRLDLDVAAGDFVAVAVADPAGGTAVASVLARRADPDSGSAVLGGRPYEALALAELRRRVHVVEHGAALFGGTVSDNIGSDKERIDDLLHAVAADELEASLPDGLDTVVTERGMSLSGGQRQRIALARALALDPAVLVLHEPTTAVDAVTEARIAARLRQRRAGATTVVITTSPAMLASADRVYFVDRGRVAEAGRHADLLVGSSAYARAVGA